MSPSTTHRLLIVALIALGTGVSLAQEAPKKEDAKATVPTAPKGGKATASPAKERGRRGPTSTADLQKLVEQANKERDTMIADYDALAKQLKDATEEQKKALTEKMKETKKAFDESMNALRRQMRDEQRKQREGASKAKN
jgi:hypothetical protein